MAQPVIKVRLAEPKDVVNIFKVLHDGYIHQTVEYAPVNDIRAYGWILSAIATGVVAVADLNGRIVGACGASPFQPGYSNAWMLDLEFFYVMKSFRDAGVTEKLLSAVEGWADQKNVPVIFGLQTGEKVNAKDRMMKMAGWTYVGGNFLRKPRGQQQKENVEHNEESSS